MTSESDTAFQAGADEPSAAGRLRPGADLRQHDRREGRAGGDARRRQDRADIYRPDTTEKLPALLAFSIHNKDLQGPEMAETGLLQPAWSMLWTGPAEAGDTRFLVSRGYVHVIGNPRGSASRKAAARAPWTATT